MKERKYIINADYSPNMPYYIGLDKDGKIFMDKLRPYDIAKEDFGYTLKEAEDIMKIYKSHTKKKMKEHKVYCQVFIENGLYPPSGKPYLATNYYLIKKTRYLKAIERCYNAGGYASYKWVIAEKDK